MKKRISAILSMAVCASMLFVGCGAKGDSSNQDGPKTDSGSS